MTNLHIALQSGFRDDSVVITVNNREIYNKSGVTTNLVISLADKVNVLVDGQNALIKVNVTSKKIEGTVTIQVTDTPYLAVDLDKDSNLQMTPSKEPFTYF